MENQIAAQLRNPTRGGVIHVMIFHKLKRLAPLLLIVAMGSYFIVRLFINLIFGV